MVKIRAIRIEELILTLNEDESLLLSKAAQLLGLPESDILSLKVIKRAIDSRNKRNIIFVYSVDVEANGQELMFAEGNALPGIIQDNMRRHKIRLQESFCYEMKPISPSLLDKRPIVVGSGPAGLFAALLLARSGLKPILLERGRDVDTRSEDVKRFFASGQLDPDSNVQFGEGGAGTFSDGKLNTLINNPKQAYIFEEMIRAGAPAEIAYDAHPHIGTDRLRQVVKNLRQEIIRSGGEALFSSCLSDIIIEDGRIKAAVLTDGRLLETDDLIIAIGHSARDTYEMLYRRGVALIAKPFSIGVRIEHAAEMVNRSQYGDNSSNPRLPAAKYKLVAHPAGERSVYTFCMCPGGQVVAAASEAGRLVTNGMSEYAQAGRNSNSALLVSVFPEDFGSNDPLAGIAFQRRLEEQAFIAGGSNYQAPVQLVGDFLDNKPSSRFGQVIPTYEPGTRPTSLASCLPDYVLRSLNKALPMLDAKIKGFASREAILTAVETRSSAPVRIVRDDSCQANIRGLYPAGEGAGYAGGITSSAIDGLSAAEAVINKYLAA